MSPARRSAARTLLLYAHDTFGLGHLRRSLAIARHVVSTRPGTQVVLMTGSPVADRLDIPTGVQVVPLPPVVKTGVDTYEPRQAGASIEVVRALRSAIMRDVARRFRPDVFLVDHAPQGMQGELRVVFSDLARRSPHTRIVLGLRDVVDDPAVVRAAWRREDVYGTMERVFDLILVYGSQDLLDVGDAYGLPASLRAKLRYCGYLASPGSYQRRELPSGDLVVGTAGGGGDGYEPLSATLEASRRLGASSVVVTGPLMDAHDRRRLEDQARSDPRAAVVELCSDMQSLVARARVVVTMGGYNSMCELVASGVATVVVPRLQPRREQAIRAELFARRGLVSVVGWGGGLACRLTAAVSQLLGSPAGVPAAQPLDLGGLARVGDLLEHEGALARVERRGDLAALGRGRTLAAQPKEVGPRGATVDRPPREAVSA